jgi:hypothetical protein
VGEGDEIVINDRDPVELCPGVSSICFIKSRVVSEVGEVHAILG